MKKLPIVAVFIIISALCISSVHAACPSGELCVSPHGSYFPYPIMLASPATFTIESANVTSGLFPNIVLVMTKASFDGMSGSIIVDWTGSQQFNESVFPKWTFQATNSGYIPSSMVTPYDTGRYNVTDLQTSLGVNGTKDDMLYYNFGPFFVGSAITQVPRQFTVTVHSTNTRVLVLAVARSGVCTPFFNMRVGPCKPGFIVPEPSPILFAAISLITLSLYASKSRKPRILAQ